MKITYWILAVILALTFGFAGFSKLSASVVMIDMFTRFGLPLWSMYFIGAVEFAGALGLVFGKIIHDRLPRLAAMGLCIVMVGAIVMHVIYDADPLMRMLPAVVLLVLLTVFLYTHRKTNNALQ